MLPTSDNQLTMKTFEYYCICLDYQFWLCRTQTVINTNVFCISLQCNSGPWRFYTATSPPSRICERNTRGSGLTVILQMPRWPLSYLEQPITSDHAIPGCHPCSTCRACIVPLREPPRHPVGAPRIDTCDHSEVRE